MIPICYHALWAHLVLKYRLIHKRISNLILWRIYNKPQISYPGLWHYCCLNHIKCILHYVFWAHTSGISVHMIYVITGNHYKWDWPKSQFCMPDDSATVVWLRNLKVGYVNLFNFLQNTLKKISFWKWEIRKLENVIFLSSAEPCRILQNSALVPQNSADHLGENHEILRISAEFCGIPYNGLCSAEPFCGTIKRNNILQKSAELSKSVLRNSAGVFVSAELFCGTLYY